jgi:hypothetical protein
MAKVRNQNALIVVTAYGGDAKSLLAFDLVTEAARKGLAGFSIQAHPPNADPYYIDNNLRLAPSPDHAQIAAESPFSSANAPIHKFRWVHVPGLVHQGGTPAFGTYTYVVTPRYFTEAGALAALDSSTSVSVDIEVGPFVSGALKLGFTRGYVQSQAFVRHFGETMHLQPDQGGLTFDTSQTAGTNADGQSYTYAQEYDWLGFTARRHIFAILQEVLDDPTLSLDVFAYDLDEPDVCAQLLKLGSAQRLRVILDNSKEHHGTPPKPEDTFETELKQATGQEAIRRGQFGRYAHDKIFIVSDSDGPRTVLTGSTNFSVNGLYINANHVLVFDDRQVAATYSQVFNEAWNTQAAKAPFIKSEWSGKTFAFGGPGSTTPTTTVTFAPHTPAFADTILTDLVARINAEATVAAPAIGSAFFAVMDIDEPGNNPVYAALRDLHANQKIFSFGISDAPKNVTLYGVDGQGGVLVSGKPAGALLQAPFNQVPRFNGQHEIHHKFVVCGFNGDDPVVYCGSSNLAEGGEQNNGDNLLAIHDRDVATAFVIEALSLVDHYNFLDSLTKNAKTLPAHPPSTPPANTQLAAAAAGWFLSTTNGWSDKYFDPTDLHCVDRRLFGS